MRLFRPPPVRKSDDERIEDLRRKIDRWDKWFERWRFWIILLYIGLLVAVLLLAWKMLGIVLQIARNPNHALAGFMGGVFVGMIVGWMIHKVLVGLLIFMTCGSHRAERFWLDYIDSLDAQQSGAEGPHETDSEFDDADERFSIS